MCSSLQPLWQWALAYPLALSLISLLSSPSLRFSFLFCTSSSSVSAVSVKVFLEIFGPFLEFFFCCCFQSCGVLMYCRKTWSGMKKFFAHFCCFCWWRFAVMMSIARRWLLPQVHEMDIVKTFIGRNLWRTSRGCYFVRDYYCANLSCEEEFVFTCMVNTRVVWFWVLTVAVCEQALSRTRRTTTTRKKLLKDGYSAELVARKKKKIQRKRLASGRQ